MTCGTVGTRVPLEGFLCSLDDGYTAIFQSDRSGDMNGRGESQIISQLKGTGTALLDQGLGKTTNTSQDTMVSVHGIDSNGLYIRWVYQIDQIPSHPPSSTFQRLARPMPIPPLSGEQALLPSSEREEISPYCQYGTSASQELWNFARGLDQETAAGRSIDPLGRGQKEAARSRKPRPAWFISRALASALGGCSDWLLHTTTRVQRHRHAERVRRGP